MPGAPTSRIDPQAGLAEQLSGEHTAGLRRYLRTLGCKPDHIDDLVQDTFVVVLQKGLGDRGRAAAAGWLRQTAKHLFLRQLRDDRARREVEIADQVFAEQCGADAGDGVVAALRACLRELPARSRRLLEGTYRDGLGRQQLGQELGMRPDGIKTALRRLRAALLHCIQGRRGRP